MLCSTLTSTGATIRPALVPQWPRPGAIDVCETVSREHLVLFTKALIQSQIERVLIVDVVLVGNEVVRCISTRGSGIKVGDVLANGIDPVLRDDVGLTRNRQSCDRVESEAIPNYSAGYHLSGKRIVDF